MLKIVAVLLCRNFKKVAYLRKARGTIAKRMSAYVYFACFPRYFLRVPYPQKARETLRIPQVPLGLFCPALFSARLSKEFGEEQRLVVYGIIPILRIVGSRARYVVVRDIVI